MFNVTNVVDFFFIDANNTIPERDMDKKDKSTAIWKIFKSIHYGNILVILFGTVLSITLMLLIAREFFKVVRKSETSGNYHFAMVTPVVNNTSDDTSETIYNSWETQDCVR